MKTLFYWTRNERMGILLLCLTLCISQAFVNIFLPKWFPPSMINKAEVKAFWAKIDSTNHTTSTISSSTPLNLNQVSVEALIAVGVPNRLANTIINYREKVSPFSSIEDLKKVYGMNSDLYRQLKAILIVPNRKVTVTSPTLPAIGKEYVQQKTPKQRFFFNPNTLPKDSLILLGIPPHLAQTIVNYRNKGGTFHKPSDLGRIYHFSSALVDTLAPWISIPAMVNQTKFEQPNALPALPILVEVDINQADAQQWATLKGIGPVLSERIVRFREKLGGFVDVEQVSETYGLPDSTFQNIRQQLIYSPLVKKIPINLVDFDVLSLHPYINRKDAQILLNYRRHHGPFIDYEALTKIKGIKPAVFPRLRPYLDFRKNIKE